jgi:hypothetical protein
MTYCEVTFVGPAFDGAEEELGSLTGKIQHAANDEAADKFGINYWPDPTDLTIWPAKTTEGIQFFVRAYHSTKSYLGQTEIFQAHDFSFRESVEPDGAYLHTDKERKYPLGIKEHFILKKLAKIATAQSVDIISTD